jgi:WD repeat-containing protein 22
MDATAGHLSIVNNALFHPHSMHVVTSGIEHHVIVHSPTPSSSCTRDLQMSPTTVRELPPASADDEGRYLRALVRGRGLGGPESSAYTDGIDEEDRESILLFDQ